MRMVRQPLLFSIYDPHSEPFGASNELFRQVSATEGAIPRVRVMADDDGSALLIPRHDEHLIGHRSCVEWRRHTGMNSRCRDARALEHSARGAQDWSGLRIRDSHPPALRRAQFSFDLFFSLRNLGAAGFQQLGWQTRGDIREMDGDSIAPRQHACDVPENSLRCFTVIDDDEELELIHVHLPPHVRRI